MIEKTTAKIKSNWQAFSKILKTNFNILTKFTKPISKDQLSLAISAKEYKL